MRKKKRKKEYMQNKNCEQSKYTVYPYVFWEQARETLLKRAQKIPEV